MFDNKITNLSLLEKYELDIHIKFDNQKPIRGKLFINQDLIYLQINNTDFNFDLNYKNLICEYRYSHEIELIKLDYLKYKSDFYSDTKDIVYTVEKVLFKENNAKNKYKKMIIKSKDINTWVGFTKLQRELGFDIKQRIFNQHKEKFKFIDCDNFILDIFYEINTNQDTLNGKITYTYLPYIELNLKKILNFEEVEKIYFELLDLFYVLLGFDLNVEQVILESEQEDFINTYFYYKKDYKIVQKNSIFVSLSNDLFEQYREELNLKIFQNYFKLNNYNKSFFKVFRKYKMFHYTEDKLLGYFRILENLMFNKNEIFTEEKLDIYIANITIEETKKIKEKQILLKGNQKIKKVIDKPIKDRKEIIKFIVFHNKVLNVLSNNHKLKVNFIDVEKIVKLRNNISHFNEYNINQNDLEKFIDYLEFLVNYVLLKLIGYSDESFLNNLGFYPAKHRVFDFENN
jgi:hypothetical protein